LRLINPSTSPNELITTLTPHSIIHGDACFAYFNKIWGIPEALLGTDFDGLIAWIDNYCQANPLKGVAEAAGALLQTLRDRALQAGR